MHRGGKAILGRTTRGETKETAEYVAMGTISSVRFLGRWQGELVCLSATAQAQCNNSRPRSVPSITGYLFLTAAREVSGLLSLVPILHLKKKAVGRKFNQVIKAVSGGGGRQTQVIRGDRAHPPKISQRQGCLLSSQKTPSIKPQSPL